VARAKPLVPESAWPLLTTLRSLTGDGPILATPSFRRVLVLSAHPDDETAGCGGVIALLTGAGATIDIAVATSGDATAGSPFSAEETGRRREEEGRRAAALLGARPPRYFGHPDGALPAHEDALADDLRGVVAEVQPEAIFLPWFLDGHPDHRAVHRALRHAGVRDDVELWGYETWTPLPANRHVDITSVYARKETALAAHETAHLGFDVGSILGLNRYRSAYATVGAGYVEGYLAAPAPAWFDLAARYGR